MTKTSMRQHRDLLDGIAQLKARLKDLEGDADRMTLLAQRYGAASAADIMRKQRDDLARCLGACACIECDEMYGVDPGAQGCHLDDHMTAYRALISAGWKTEQ